MKNIKKTAYEFMHDLDISMSAALFLSQNEELPKFSDFPLDVTDKDLIQVAMYFYPMDRISASNFVAIARHGAINPDLHIEVVKNDSRHALTQFRGDAKKQLRRQGDKVWVENPSVKNGGYWRKGSSLKTEPHWTPDDMYNHFIDSGDLEKWVKGSRMNRKTAKQFLRDMAEAFHSDTFYNTDKTSEFNKKYANYLKDHTVSYDLPELGKKFTTKKKLDSEDEKEPADYLVEKAIATSAKPINNLLKTAKNWMSKFNSLEEIRDNLPKLYDELNGDAFGEHLEQYMLLAHLAGQSEVLDEYGSSSSSEADN